MASALHGMSVRCGQSYALFSNAATKRVCFCTEKRLRARKGHGLRRETPRFAVQDAVFRSARCRVLQRKMPCFAARDATFCGAGRHGWGGADEKKTRKVLLISKEMSIFAHTHHHERMRKAMNQTASPTVLMPVHPCLRPQPTARRNHYQHKQQHHEPKPAIPARSPGDALRLDAAHRVCRQRL